MIWPNTRKGFDMSYKDLEAEIRAWANLEAHAKQMKEDAQEARRQGKRDKRAKKLGKGPLTPKAVKSVDRPIKHMKRITIECRPILDRHWGEPVELSYEVETISDAECEVAAIRQAREDGYSFDKVVHIESYTK